MANQEERYVVEVADFDKDYSMLEFIKAIWSVCVSGASNVRFVCWEHDENQVEFLSDITEWSAKPAELFISDGRLRSYVLNAHGDFTKYSRLTVYAVHN